VSQKYIAGVKLAAGAMADGEEEQHAFRWRLRELEEGYGEL
jgi:hypothetical protein